MTSIVRQRSLLLNFWRWLISTWYVIIKMHYNQNIRIIIGANKYEGWGWWWDKLPQYKCISYLFDIIIKWQIPVYMINFMKKFNQIYSIKSTSIKTSRITIKSEINYHNTGVFHICIIKDCQISLFKFFRQISKV
jgi:hypothetical protein